MTLTSNELETFEKALYFLRMDPLRAITEKLQLPSKGIKRLLIERLFTFIKTGTFPKIVPFPEVSKAKSKTVYPLAPETLILYGNYKNDAATRDFMKRLVGSHFHFTARGIDWIKACWQEGKPPTYAQFAQYWQKQYLSERQQKSKPKQEWAYLTFVQTYLKQHPQASQGKVMSAWKLEQEAQTQIVLAYLEKSGYTLNLFKRA